MGLADLHVHTIYSYDGTASVAAVLRRAKEVGLDVIAITDHDEIRGALLAEELAPKFGVAVATGMEITTVEGDLLAFSIHQPIRRGLSLIETVLQVGEQGGFCIAPHPMASTIGMHSLNAFSIRRALLHPDASQILLGIETYNATVLDRQANIVAHILAERSDLAQTGSSDAHVLEAIGLGATEFPGRTVEDLVAALRKCETRVVRGKQWGAVRTLGSWATEYLKSAPTRLSPVFFGARLR